VTIVPSLSLRRERVGWERLPWRRLLSAFEVVFVMGNSSILSNALLAGLVLLRGGRLVLWGQAHAAGANALTERLRPWWWHSSDNLFVYTDADVRWLRARGFRSRHIVGMKDGLDQLRIDEVTRAWDDRSLALWRERSGVLARTQVLTCARLEPENRFADWLVACPV
jgi:hypothetical protein